MKELRLNLQENLPGDGGSMLMLSAMDTPKRCTLCGSTLCGLALHLRLKVYSCKTTQHVVFDLLQIRQLHNTLTELLEEVGEVGDII